jgi:PAS domain-containing protein
LIGKTSEWLLHPDDRDKTRAERARLAKGERTLRFESRMRRKDGTFRWLSWKAVPDRGLVYAVGRQLAARPRYPASEGQLRHGPASTISSAVPP